MSESGFRNLAVWQKSKDLAIGIYKVTNKGLFSKDFGLRDQMRRAVISIPSNIAEGTSKIQIRNWIFIHCKGFIVRTFNTIENLQRNWLHK